MLLGFDFYFVLFFEMLPCCSFDAYFPFWLVEPQVAFLCRYNFQWSGGTGLDETFLKRRFP